MADTTENTTTTDTIAGGDTTTTTTGTPDLAAQLATVMAQLATLTTAKEASDKAAEEAKRASMSESEKLAADRAALDNEKKSMLLDARKSAAEKLGIQPKAMPLVPDVDPRTPEGAKALSDWALANPEFIVAKTGQSLPTQVDSTSLLGKMLSGALKNPYISQDGLRRLLGGN